MSVLALALLGHLPVSAASGLVARRGELYVVADDETVLVGTAGGGPFDRRIPLVGDVLPEAHAERKRAKPDFESLALLPDGRLLALGSGSTERRCRGVLVDVDHGRSHVFDAAQLFAALARELPELNLEGATVHDGALLLAQRGNGAAGVSALVHLDVAAFLGEAERGAVGGASLRSIARIELGELDGVRLTPTDLTSDGTRVFFSAAAEAGDSTYLDGECRGSALGVLALDGRVEARVDVMPRTKLEGLTLAPGGGALLCVSDPDDRSVRAPLFRAEGGVVAEWLRG